MLNCFQAPHNVIRYFLNGDDRVQTYFSVDDVTGEISVRRSLTDDEDRPDTYTVRLQNFYKYEFSNRL